MPREEAPIYCRGKYRLEPDVDAIGNARSPNLAVWWYDRSARRTRSRSCKTAEVDAAITFLDRMFLADKAEAVAFCPTCGHATADACAYLLVDALADYKLEIGEHRTSASSIKARLGNVIDFLQATHRTEMTCADADIIVDTLRRWLAARPVTWRNKSGVVTRSRQRSPAAVEEAVHQLRAALTHAVTMKRSNAVPTFKGRPRADVSPLRTERGDVALLARFLAYAADPAHPRRRPLHAFLVGSICTLGRPDAVVDISTSTGRRQLRTKGLIDLNPAGRTQTRKRRPMVPTPPPFGAWLDDVAADPSAKGWLCEVAGEPIVSVRSAWRTMLRKLSLPQGREMQPYLIRHTMASLCRDYGATEWDLKGQMGKRATGTVEIYAVSSLFGTAQTAIAGILADIEKAAPGAMHRRRTGIYSNDIRLGSAPST